MTPPPVAPERPETATEPGLPGFRRIFRGFLLARALLGALVLAMQAGLSLLSASQPSAAVLALCATQALASLALLAWLATPGTAPADTLLDADGRLRSRGAVLTLGVDLVTFGALLALAEMGDGPNVGALLVLPALMGAALLPRRAGLAVAAGAALWLLAAAGWHAAIGGADAAARLSQAGLTGAAMLTIAFFTRELADRLAREEAAARHTLRLAREQAQLNRLMIEEMQDGVMVVDVDLRVRAANPAALALIGQPEDRPARHLSLRDQPGWVPLQDILQQAFQRGSGPLVGEEVTLQLLQDRRVEERRLRLRLRFTRHFDGADGAVLCLVFLEDARQWQARARQEKLAAMGRMSAGIAHEIRNPLAAIAQANALLGEDLRDPAALRLATIIEDNVGRLQRIVDDVLEVAPGGEGRAPRIDLAAQVRAVCTDWAATARLEPPERLSLDLPDQAVPVRFEPDALRRVLVNLLENGLRHGSTAADALRVRVQARRQARGGHSEALLTVASDGEAIAPDVEPYLFEPFFSTRSRGSGLGLYICRALCERHGATIDYRGRGPAARHRNLFVVALPLLERPAPGADGPASISGALA